MRKIIFFLFLSFFILPARSFAQGSMVELPESFLDRAFLEYQGNIYVNGRIGSNTGPDGYYKIAHSEENGLQVSEGPVQLTAFIGIDVYYWSAIFRDQFVFIGAGSVGNSDVRALYKDLAGQVTGLEHPRDYPNSFPLAANSNGFVAVTGAGPIYITNLKDDNPSYVLLPVSQGNIGAVNAISETGSFVYGQDGAGTGQFAIWSRNVNSQTNQVFYEKRALAQPPVEFSGIGGYRPRSITDDFATTGYWIEDQDTFEITSYVGLWRSSDASFVRGFKGTSPYILKHDGKNYLFYSAADPNDATKNIIFIYVEGEDNAQPLRDFFSEHGITFDVPAGSREMFKVSEAQISDEGDLMILGDLPQVGNNPEASCLISANIAAEPDPLPLPANLAISKSPRYDFPEVGVGGVASVNLSIVNQGELPALIERASVSLPAPFYFNNGSYPSANGTVPACDTVIEPGASCRVTVRFAPAAGGTFDGEFSLLYRDANNTTPRTLSRALRGLGASDANVFINQNPKYVFPVTKVGNTAPYAYFSLSNVGDSAATLKPINLIAPFQYRGGSFPGTGGTCTLAVASLAARANCRVAVSFVPTAIGTFSGSLIVPYQGSSSANVQKNAVRALEGTSTGGANVTINRGPVYNFPDTDVGLYNEIYFNLTNNGASAATLIPQTLAAPFTYRDSGVFPGTGSGACGSTLLAGSSCRVYVRFAPRDMPVVGNVFNAALAIRYDDGLGNILSYSREMSGRAVDVATLVMANGTGYVRAKLANVFPNTRVNIESAALYIGITNTGSRTATLAPNNNALAVPFAYRRAGVFPGTGGTCGTTLAKGTSCRIALAFLPRAVGLFRDEVEIAYDNGAGQTRVLRRALEGSGIN